MPQHNRTNVRFISVVHKAAGVAGRLWPWAASRLLERLLLTPARPRRRATEPELPSTEPVRVTIAGRQVDGWTFGTGPVVLLVHGWNGDARNWREMAGDVVSAGFRVVAFDAPAHGAAPRRMTNVVEWKDAITAIGSHVGPLHGIVGHSFGSLACLFAVHTGLPVERLVLLSPPADLARITVEFGRAIGFPDRVANDVLDRLGVRLDLRWDSVHAPKLAAGLHQPMLVIHDREDREVRWQDGREISAAAPRGRLLSTIGLGHRRILRDPTVTTAVSRFLTEGDVPKSTDATQVRSQSRADPFPA